MVDDSDERIMMSVKCDQCDKTFDRKHHMIRHVIAFHDKVPCHLCDYKTHSTFNLRVHMRQTHKGPQGPYNGKTLKQACLFCLQNTHNDLTNKVAEITDLRMKLGKKNNELKIAEETISKLKQEKLKLISTQALEIESYQTENNILKNDNHILLDENVKLVELKVENEILAATILQMKRQEGQKNVVILTAENSSVLLEEEYFSSYEEVEEKTVKEEVIKMEESIENYQDVEQEQDQEQEKEQEQEQEDM